ncbi:MAG: phosphotransferase family protein [Anaerolineae bacterium]|nr:phosphotransferase family protein [Chloroflexota bacterium]MBP6298177.1 phosphotransferase family protein [Anaerolineae bacterium]
MSILSTGELPQQLGRYLTEVTRLSTQITGAQVLAGGASRDSWAFSAEFSDGTHGQFVLRRDLPTTMNDTALTRAQEFMLLQSAYAHGVRCPRVRWMCIDPEPLGMPFLIMDYVTGISIGRKVMTAPELESARKVLPAQMAAQLALIHSLDWRGQELGFLSQPTTSSPSREAVRDLYALLDRLNVAIPALEYALRWCDIHAPEAPRITFIHGDFRVGNLLVDADGLAAVIDWEFAHVGDPTEELGYLCLRDWRFGNDALRAAGLSKRESFLIEYEKASGTTVNRSSVDWWEVMGNVRWAAICLNQAERHLSGQDPSVELASLGRRSIDMQAEALSLIRRLEETRA